MSQTTTRELFGGAITTTLPANLIDASDIRQVPDTQEVFLWPDSANSLIVEVLESVEPSDPTDAAKFHFDSLAHDNSAQSQQVLDTEHATNDSDGATPNPVLLSGKQAVRKFNKEAVDEVYILLALYRIPQKNVDLVMSMNVPIIPVDGGSQDLQAAQDIFRVAAKALRIVDYGLFA